MRPPTISATGAVEDFGEPALIAQRFADELATVESRRATFRGFAALAVGGRSASRPRGCS